MMGILKEELQAVLAESTKEI